MTITLNDKNYDADDILDIAFYRMNKNEETVRELGIKIQNTTDERERTKLGELKYKLELNQFKLNRSYRELLCKISDMYSKRNLELLGKLTDQDRKKIKAVREAGLRRMNNHQ